MCRLYEDQLNESKTKVDELQRQLMDITSHKARAQTECGQCPTSVPVALLLEHCFVTSHTLKKMNLNALQVQCINVNAISLSANRRGWSQTGRERSSGHAAAANKDFSQSDSGRAQETAGRGMQSEPVFPYTGCIVARLLMYLTSPRSIND